MTCTTLTTRSDLYSPFSYSTRSSGGGGVRTLYLGSSIHIRYSGLSVHQQRKIDKMMESFMDGEELSAAIEGRWKGQV